MKPANYNVFITADGIQSDPIHTNLPEPPTQLRRLIRPKPRSAYMANELSSVKEPTRTRVYQYAEKRVVRYDEKTYDPLVVHWIYREELE